MGVYKKKIRAGSYEVFDSVTSRKIGEVHKTGTHLDDYPWDWSLGAEFRAKLKRTTGVSESLRVALDEMMWAVRKADEGREEQRAAPSQ